MAGEGRAGEGDQQETKRKKQLIVALRSQKSRPWASFVKFYSRIVLSKVEANDYVGSA